MSNPPSNDFARESARGAEFDTELHERPLLGDGFDTLDGEGPDDVSLDGSRTQSFVLRGERLAIGTETHEWGRVKVTRRIVTEERTITVPVRREELVVEYLDDAKPSVIPGVVRGSTESIGSRVVEEYVLLEEVPEVSVVTREREKVSLVVDTQRALVNYTDEVSREEVTVDGDHAPRTEEQL